MKKDEILNYFLGLPAYKFFKDTEETRKLFFQMNKKEKQAFKKWLFSEDVDDEYIDFVFQNCSDTDEALKLLIDCELFRKETFSTHTASAIFEHSWLGFEYFVKLFKSMAPYDQYCIEYFEAQILEYSPSEWIPALFKLLRDNYAERELTPEEKEFISMLEDE